MFHSTPTCNSYDQFVTAVQQFPMLSHEDEIRHANAHKNTGDLEAAHILVTSHLRLVVSIARKYDGYGLPPADVVQEGTIGLMKAVKKYDPEQGIRLTTYAICHIKSEIMEYVIRQGRTLKIASTKAQRKLFFNLRKMKTTSFLSVEEATRIASELNVPLADVWEMDARLSGRDVPFDLSPDDDDHDMFTIGDVLMDTGADPVEILEDRERAQRIDALQRCLAGLDDRSRDIIQSRQLTDQPATLSDLAAKYGVSIERIRQIEAKAITRLRQLMQ